MGAAGQYTGTPGAAQLGAANNWTALQTFAAGLAIAAGQALSAPTIGPDATRQHVLPVVASDTVALLAASQTLTNKTLTSPTLGGTVAGAPAWASAQGFPTLTSIGTNVVVSAAGLTAARTYTFPDASQALAGLTTAQSFAGAQSWNAGGTARVTDAATAAATTVVTLVHNSGTGAGGAATELLFLGSDSTTAEVEYAAIRGAIQTAAHASFAASLNFLTRTAAATKALNFVMWGSGGFSSGNAWNATDPGANVMIASAYNVGSTSTAVQGTSTSLTLGANGSNAATQVIVQCNVTTGGTGNAIIAWNKAGTRSAGTMFSVGDGGSFTAAWSIDFNGRMKNERSANEQTTIGAAGAAAALPAQPLGYLKATRSDGTAIAIPYYNAA